MDADSFMFSFKSVKGLIKDLKNFLEVSVLVIWVRLRNYIPKKQKKVVWRIKLETAPQLDLDEAVFLRVKFFLKKNIKPNNSQCKQKRVEDQKKHYRRL